MGFFKSSLPMRRDLQRFRALERAARGTFLRAAAMLPLIALSLRLRGFRKTQAYLQKFLSLPNLPPIVSVPQKADAIADMTARMARAAARRTLGRATCLEQSLALWWLLGRQGITCELRVGVRKNGEEFEAHAWVECGGIAVAEPEGAHPHYSAFDAALVSLPPVAK